MYPTYNFSETTLIYIVEFKFHKKKEKNKHQITKSKVLVNFINKLTLERVSSKLNIYN